MWPVIFEVRLNQMVCFAFKSPTMIIGKIEFRRLSSSWIIKVFPELLYKEVIWVSVLYILTLNFFMIWCAKILNTFMCIIYTYYLLLKQIKIILKIFEVLIRLL